MVEEIVYHITYSAYWSASSLGETAVALGEHETDQCAHFESATTTLPCPLTSRRKAPPFLEPVRERLPSLAVGQAISLSTPSVAVYGSFGCPARSVPPDSQVIFNITITEITSIPVEPRMSDESIRDEALELKEAGNAAIAAKDLALARTKYLEGLFMLSRLPSVIADVLIPFIVNAAHCDLQQQRYASAMAECEYALNLNPNSPLLAKLHYRIASVYEACCYYKAALWHLHRNYDLAPSNALAKRMREVKEKVEMAQADKKRTLFDGMFGAGGYNGGLSRKM